VKPITFFSAISFLGLAGCSSESGATAGAGGAAGSTAGTAGSTQGSGGSTPGSGGSTATSLTHDEVKALVETYKAAHPGNGGKDWDINANYPAQPADPDGQRLRALCGADQLPVIPSIAWEYGGSDHQWINPQASALVYCVYVPVNPGTSHWSFDAATGTTTADMYVLFPDQNPCKDKVGADQVMACLGDPTNIEIIVDTININDGADVGLSLSTTPTDVMLIQTDGTKVLLYHSA
jgi:hypothetical protein